MSFEEKFLGFLIALAAGALIGLERQQDKATQLTPGIGGVRTFPLIGLVGALSAFLAQTLGVWPIVDEIDNGKRWNQSKIGFRSLSSRNIFWKDIAFLLEIQTC